MGVICCSYHKPESQSHSCSQCYKGVHYVAHTNSQITLGTILALSVSVVTKWISCVKHATELHYVLKLKVLHSQNWNSFSPLIWRNRYMKIVSKQCETLRSTVQSHQTLNACLVAWSLLSLAQWPETDYTAFLVVSVTLKHIYQHIHCVNPHMQNIATSCQLLSDVSFTEQR